MKKVLISLVLLYLIINSAPIEPRWGITKPVADKSIEKQLATAYDLLYDLKFDTAKVIYQKVIDKFPNNAEAHLGISITYRYTGKTDDALIECQKALELDSNAVGIQLNYAELLAPYRRIKLKEPLSDSARYALSIAYFQKAESSSHPLSAYSHIGLWANYISLGQFSRARQQMFELGRKKYFPKMVTDFAYNMLISLPPDAILFTQGDNEAYPMLSLQEYEGFRRDVRVIKIGMLVIPKALSLLRDSLKVPISYSDSESIKLDYPEPLFTQVLTNIIENAHKMGHPVYFAALDSARMGEYQNNLVKEGLVWRVVDVKTMDSIDIDKVIKNMVEKYRLDNIGRKEVWSANFSPIIREYLSLGINYLASYNMMAEHYKKIKENDKAIDCYRRMIKIAELIDGKDFIKMFLDKWLELKPDDEEAKNLKEKYFKDS